MQNEKENYAYLLGELLRLTLKLSTVHGNMEKWSHEFMAGEIYQVCDHLTALYRDLEAWAEYLERGVVVETQLSPLEPLLQSCDHLEWEVIGRHSHGVDVACVVCGKQETDRFSDFESIDAFFHRGRNIIIGG